MPHSSELRGAVDHLIQARDGRQIGVVERGPEYGVPIVALMGNPGSAQATGVSYAVLHELGIREIAIDRPGMGNSDRKPGLVVADTRADIHDVTDALGLEHYGIFARSGGVPGGLCAVDNRVSAAFFAAGLAPPDEDMDWFAQMNSNNRAEQESAREGSDLLDQRIDEYAARLAENPNFLLHSVLYPHLQPDDYLALLHCWPQSQVTLGHARGIAGGHGWKDHTRALHLPWGRDIRSIDGHFPDGTEGRITFWHGGEDPFSSPEHSRRLHEHVSGSRLIEDPEGSHFTILLLMSSAYQTIRDGHIGPQRANFIELLNTRRLQEFYGPDIDLDKPTTVSEHTAALGAIASGLSGDSLVALQPSSREQKIAQSIIARRCLGDDICYPEVTREVLTSTDAELEDKYPELWQRAQTSSA